jgi:hypothetical protein
MMTIKRLSACLLLLLFISGFAQDNIIEQDESFDPLELYEPSLPILDGSLIYEIITDIRQTTAAERANLDTARIVEKMGWKVQLFSTTDFYRADTVYNQAAADFFDQDVVKLFNSPYYKIRVGNCTSREQAEELLNRAIDLKYRDAWIIRTTIKTEERRMFH